MIIAPPNPESRQITKMLTDLEIRMKRAEVGLRAAQLKNASITDGAVNVYDGNGNLRSVIGRQRDGTYNAVSTNNPNPPPVPAAGIAIPALASIIARHTGETASGVSFPSDFSHLNIWYAPLQNPEDWTAGGSLLKFPDELPIAPLEYTEYLVAFSAVNLSGKESAKSQSVSATPKQVVPNDMMEGWADQLALSAGAVTEASLAAGSVTETKIAPDSIASPMIKVGNILGVHILAATIDGGKLTAQAITAREIAAFAVTANAMSANSVTAGALVAGSVTAIKLETNLAIVNRLVAGSLNGNRVELHPLQGLQAFTSGGTVRSFWIDAATGNALLIGEIRTAASGARIILNPGGNQPDRIQFWPDGAGGTADFAFIDSFPEGTTGTGITMQASGGQAEKVGTIWLRKTYAALGIADNGLVAGSQFYAEPNFVRCRSATVDLIVDQALTAVAGPRRVAILNYNTSGAVVSNSRLFYGTATANQLPMMYSPGFNVAMIWDIGSYLAVVHNDAGFSRAPIEASEFRVGSDTRLKHSIQDVPWGEGALGIVTSSPSKMYKYHKETKRNYEELDEFIPRTAQMSDGKVRKDNNGDTVFKKTTLKTEDTWQVGPMADDLPPELVYIDPTTSMKKVNLASMIGVLWKAIEELTAKIKELEDER